MKLIVGLGNPDAEYENTFHNLGFMCVDSTAKLLGVEFNKKKCKALIAETFFNGEKVILAKPQTYMNLSGESVREILSFYKIPVENMLVMYDDYDLPKGNFRMRESGSAGTHNGMRNIVKEIGNTNFPRIRIGFKPNDGINIPLIDLVLSGIKKEDRALFDASIEKAGKASIDFIKGVKIADIMQKYNGK